MNVPTLTTPTCGRCNQPVRDFRQRYDWKKYAVILSGACGCGYQEHEIPDPRFRKERARGK